VQYQLLKTGLVLDLHNLYFALQGRYGKRKLQIGEYVKYLEKQGHTLTYKIAYGRQKPEDVSGFVDLLRNLGFEVNFGNQQWTTAMALRVADITPNIDCLVLGANFHDAGRMLAWAKERGKLTKCFASDIPPFFKQYAECIEIPPEILSEAVDTTKPMELPADSSRNTN
jgi:hypothetical protein